MKAAIVEPAQTGAAILAWAVAGCARWFAEGLGEPETVMQATAAYRRSQEPLADFVADCCTLDPELSVPATHLREEYERWCRSDGVKHPLAGKAWGAALRALGCTDHRTAEGRRWNGIDIRPSDGEPLETEPEWVRG